MSISYEEARDLLQQHDQTHVLRYWDGLSEKQRADLLFQIGGLDFDRLEVMRGLLRVAGPEAERSEVVPAGVARPSEQEKNEARRAGEESMRAVQVGVLLAAGGQGSRLGYDGPKGCFPIGPITNASLFAIHSRKILGLERKYRGEVPLYVMTGPQNDKATREFFDEHDYFGLSRNRVRFFSQGTWPALWPDGRIVLDRPDHMFMSPDGHGGVLAALRAGGELDDMIKRGLTTLFYFQADNPLVEIADPAFIGLHRRCNVEMSVKVCAKRDPEEGLGLVVERDGRNEIVEYTEMSYEQKHERLPDGRLKFALGSVGIHVFSLDFVRKETLAELPLHVAHKKIPYCDDNGRTLKPEKPNAFKFEKFIFDILPDAERTLNVEFVRGNEFSPVKNASGFDSPQTAQRDMIRKYAGWLRECGVEIPGNETGESLYRIEIDPCFALGADDLRGKLAADFRITGDVLLADNADNCGRISR